MDRAVIQRALADVQATMEQMEMEIERERARVIAERQLEKEIEQGVKELRSEVDRCIRRIGGAK